MSPELTPETLKKLVDTENDFVGCRWVEDEVRIVQNGLESNHDEIADKEGVGKPTYAGVLTLSCAPDKSELRVVATGGSKTLEIRKDNPNKKESIRKLKLMAQEAGIELLTQEELIAERES